MKAYLGDGVHVDFDGWQLVLTAENGICATDTIHLEPEVFTQLVRYHEGIIDAQARARSLTLDVPAPPPPEA